MFDSSQVIEGDVGDVEGALAFGVGRMEQEAGVRLFGVGFVLAALDLLAELVAERQLLTGDGTVPRLVPVAEIDAVAASFLLGDGGFLTATSNGNGYLLGSQF